MWADEAELMFHVCVLLDTGGGTCSLGRLSSWAMSSGRPSAGPRINAVVQEVLFFGRTGSPRRRSPKLSKLLINVETLQMQLIHLLRSKHHQHTHV